MTTALALAAALAAAVPLAAPSPGPAGAPGAATLRVGTNRALGTVTPYVGRTKGFFTAQGVALELVDFSDGSTLMEAFAAGQIDVALLGIAPATIWRARGVPLRIVAAANGGGHVLLTREDTGITSLAGLRGKKVATPKPGTVVDTLFRAHVLRELAHLEPEKDVTIIPNVAPADMPAALLVAREVDAAITWEPFASQAEAQFRGTRVLFDGAAEWRKSHPGAPLYPVNVVVARQELIDRRPQDLRRFLAGYEETLAFMNGRPAEANEAIAAELKLPAAVVAAARRRIDYGSRVDVQAALQTLGWSRQLGYVKEIPPESALFDLAPLGAVVASRGGR